MTAPDLLPCPFCGCEPDGHEGSHVSCRCGAMGPLEIAGDPESPTWNTRATPAAMTPEVQALVEAAEDAEYDLLQWIECSESLTQAGFNMDGTPEVARNLSVALQAFREKTNAKV